MECGNVYEVFQLEDRVKVIEPRLIYYGQTGTIVQIEDISYNTEPIYTVRLNKTHIPFDDHDTPLEIKVNTKGLEKILRREDEEETIVMGLRSSKTYLTKRGTDEMKNVDVKKIVFSGPKTIVLWTDRTKTIVSMSKDELRFDPEAAFCAAYTKKMFGSNSKIKRIIAEMSNYEDWKEKEEPDDQLYKLGLKALAKCEDIDLKTVESMTKDTEKFKDKLAQMMYEILTGHPYEGEKNNVSN